MSESDERELFREHMRGVKPLAVEPREALARPKPVPSARFTRADQQEVLRESLLPPADDAVLGTGDELSFRRPHVPPGILTKLRRGHYAVDAEIDLHGLTAVEARAALRAFIAESIARRLTCVRVIHGKGRRSGTTWPCPQKRRESLAAALGRCACVRIRPRRRRRQRRALRLAAHVNGAT